MKLLEGKVALITGAARNQGRAYAQALAEEGASIIVHYHSAASQDEAQQTVQAVEQAGAKALAVQADLTQVSQIHALFETAHNAFGRLDILINNAGMVLKKPLAEVTETEYDQIFGINAKAAFFCMQEAAKRIEDNGRIINIGTTLLGATTGFYAAYAGSKAPMEHFTRALAWELGSRGITVNTVAPGPLNTSFFYPVETQDSIAYLTSRSVAGRLGEVSDIVPLVRFLALPEAQWITAQTLFINGGFTAR